MAFVMKEVDYYELIIDIYKTSRHNRNKAIVIVKKVIPELLDWGLDTQYKYNILSDLGLTLKDYNTKTSELEKLTEMEEVCIKALSFKIMLRAYRK